MSQSQNLRLSAMRSAPVHALLTLAILLIVPTAGCRKSNPTSADRILEDIPSEALSQGLAIHVTQSPITPVQTPDDPGSAPLAGARILIVREPGGVVGTAISDDSGLIFVELNPGTYRLVAQSYGNAAYPIPPGPERAEVPAGGVGQALLDYDTGIR